MGHVQDSISNVCIIYHMKVHMVSYDFGQKKLQIQNEQQTDLKTAIVATIRKNWEQWKVRAIFETKCFLNLSQDVSQKK